MNEDWRVRVTFGDPDDAAHLAKRLATMRIEDDVRRRLGERVTVSRDGSELFLYASNEGTARLAEDIVRSDVSATKASPRLELTRWHDDAEDWEPAATPLPHTDEERAAERARLMQREDREAIAQGYPEWEVRVEFPTHHEAREFAGRLEDEAVPHVRHWRYLLIGATDEDAAQGWAERIRREASGSAQVSVEGTLASVERLSPFSILGF